MYSSESEWEALLNVMNFVDRQLLASFAKFIAPDLGLSNTQFGLLTGFAFILFYATIGLFMGALADLAHRPRLIAAGVTLWSGLTAASGAARSFVDAQVEAARIRDCRCCQRSRALAASSSRLRGRA